MKIGYIRLSKCGPSLKEQQSALRAAGIKDFGKTAPVYIDRYAATKAKAKPAPFRQRAKAIENLREGDELVVASAGRLGTTSADLVEVLEAITLIGASVFDVATGERIVLCQKVIATLAFLERAREEERRHILAKARAKKAALGAHRGPPVKLSGKAREEARRAWEDMTLTANDVVKRTGVSESTLRRLFGPKGTPRFGREVPTS